MSTESTISKDEPLWTLSEVCARLKVCPRTLDTYRAEYGVPVVRRRRSVRISETALQKLITQLESTTP